ncbi:TIGR04282 family arsenosugar biosynthesis glycosyltransferase [Nesterenkonia halobia]|uniref:DUF2064 domain-containing protein n=1 Tax=Nesterenkonia halobia TaxID=37922 RepID=A0ABP6RC62_9MICC
MSDEPTLLIVARAPVAGQAKSRLAATVGDEPAAQMAAAALLDTLETAEALGWPLVVAMTGELRDAARAEEIAAVCARHRVVAQRGEDFTSRLIAAHHDADAGRGVVQIGMDTPQVSADDLRRAAVPLEDHEAALGPAEDGGWWVLGVREPGWTRCLTEVPMSRPDTGAQTAAALERSGARVGRVPPLADVDTWADALAVAALRPGGRFAAEVSRTPDHEQAGPSP